tara:strand:+ start:573 stop:998 length:426 start_codon:yes stop_codon:yes gene_type:complete
MSRAEKVFILGTIFWLLLQLSRVIALALIVDINAGLSSEAWRYPAYLDLFAVIFALPLIWAVWACRGFLTWVALIMYWVISIIDHFGNFVTTIFVGPPSIADGMNPFVVPAVQTLLDILLLGLLFVPQYRDLFFRVQKSAS